MTKEKKVEIICGCFRGSIEEFEKKVEETHSGTVYEKQYKSIINVIKIKFGLTDFTQFTNDFWHCPIMVSWFDSPTPFINVALINK